MTNNSSISTTLGVGAGVSVDNQDGLGEDETVIQTHLADEQYGEFEVIVEIEAENDELDARTPGEGIRLVYSRGGDNIEPPERTFEYQGAKNAYRTVVGDEPTSIAYYLFALEQRIGASYSEDEVVQTLDVPEGIDLAPYYSWCGELTQADRRLRLIDLWEERIEYGDWLSEKYMENWDTEFRQTGLTDESRVLAEEIAESTEQRTTLCYWTAQNAAIEYQDNDRVEYAEGIVLPKQASHAVRHAWIEVDGRVVELTWPWHDLDGSEAVYQGVKIPTETVAKQRENHSHGGPAILNEKGKKLMGKTL